MVDKIFVKRFEGKIVDYKTYEENCFEEEKVTESLIEEMIDTINEENMDLIGYFETKKELEKALKDFDEENNRFDTPHNFEIEWVGPDFYIIWAYMLGGDVSVVNYEEVLSTEYDAGKESLITWIADKGIWYTEDIKDAVMDMCKIDIDSDEEQNIEAVILENCNEFDENTAENSYISSHENINNKLRLESDEIFNIINEI